MGFKKPTTRKKWKAYSDEQIVKLTSRDAREYSEDATEYWLDNYLPARGITPEIASNVRLSLDIDTEDLVFPEYSIPVKGRKQTLTGRYRVRLYDPPDDQKFDQPKGSGSFIWAPPPKKHPVKVHKHWVILSEGETRAAIHAWLGYRSFSLPGIDNYHMAGEKQTLVGMLREQDWEGVHVIYVVDRDTASRAKLQQKVLDCCALLQAAGANVHIQWPRELIEGFDEHIGADDLYSTMQDDEYRQWLAEATPYSELMNTWGTTAPKMQFSDSPIELAILKDSPPEPTYVWDNMVRAGEVGLFVGQGGVGKSFGLQTIAMGVAAGLPVFGHDTLQGAVLHASYEDNHDDFQRRMYSMFQTLAQEFDEVTRRRFEKSLPAKYFFQSLVGAQRPLLELRDGNIIHNEAVVQYYISWIRSIADQHDKIFRLLIIDPLSRTHTCPDESQSWGTNMISCLERIAEETGVAVLAAHHTGKSNDKNADNAYYIRGASALVDAARCSFNMVHVTADEWKRYKGSIELEDVQMGRIVRLVNAKHNHTAKTPDTFMRRSAHGVLIPISVKDEAATTSADQMRELYRFFAGVGKFTKNKVVARRKDIFSNADITVAEAKSIVDYGVSGGWLLVDETAMKARRDCLSFNPNMAENFKAVSDA